MTAIGEQSPVSLIVSTRTLRRAKHFTMKSARVPYTFDRWLTVIRL